MTDRSNPDNESELKELKSASGLVDDGKDGESTSALMPENYSTETSTMQNEMVIDHKAEAMKGNFMPSALMIERKQFNINSPINANGDTLLHVAVTFSYLNVVRTLLEIFEADINATNNQGQTPLHRICSNKLKDTFILAYFIKNDNIKLDIADKEGVTPLMEAIMNHYTYAFLTLAYLKCRLEHKDIQGNSLFYYALKFDNKTALRFLIRHGESLSSLTKTLSGEKRNLSDLLIECKGTKCVRYLLKYHNDALSPESLSACTKKLGEFSHYNKFSYELIKTSHNYKAHSPMKALSSISLGQYEFKVFNLYFWFVNLFMAKATRTVRRTVFIAYAFIMCTLFAYYYFILNPNLTFSLGFLFAVYQLSSYAFFLIAFIKLFLFKPDPTTTEPAYYFLNKETEKDTIAYTIHQAFERNIFDLPNEDEICVNCLIKKQKTTNHCHRCNRCVKEFYFHSVHLDVCIHAGNAGYYFTYLSCLWFIHFSLLIQFYHYVNLLNAHTLYNSTHFFANFYDFVNHLTMLQFIFLVYLLISGVIIFGHSMAVLICKGTQVPFYLMFRYHKIPSSVIMQRGQTYNSIPEINLITLQAFCKNLWCGRADKSVPKP